MTFKDLHFEHGPVSLDVLAAVDFESALSDTLDPERIPYWAVLWDSAFALARWAVDRGGWLGVPVLEVGCGVGLAGLAAASLGARVTQTDLFPEAVALARANAQRNALAEVEQYAADWRAWPLAREWPALLGSDVTYERAAHAPLLEVLGRAVAPGGAAYLADPGREMTVDFLVRAEAAGWGIEIESIPPDPHERRVFVYTLTRRSPVRTQALSRLRSP